jgi:hypothetical protein
MMSQAKWCELMGIETLTVNHESQAAPPKWAHPHPTSPLIHNFEALIHTLVHNFWQGNGTNGDLSAEIAIPTVRPRLTSPVSR